MTAVFLGPCEETGLFVTQSDPCQSVFCPAGSVCHLGTDGQAVCKCADHCEEETDPVCGSDGVMVSRTCGLDIQILLFIFFSVLQLVLAGETGVCEKEKYHSTAPGCV